MRKLFLIGCAALVGACGGGGNNNNNNGGNNGTPGLKTFSYGSPAAPTQQQQNTANTAQTQLNSAATGALSGSVAGAANLPAMTDSLANSLPASLIAAPTEVPDLTSGEGPASFLARHTGELNAGCYQISQSTITYSNCTISSTGLTETINGTLSVANDSVSTWNLTVTWNYSASGISETGTYTWTGNVTFTGSTIVGQGRSSFTGHYSGNGVTVDYSYSAGFDSNLTYQKTPSFCFASGTLEIRRNLNTTTNAQVAPVKDAGAKYTWTGCGAVTVQKGT
jgi:hypothetical protein